MKSESLFRYIDRRLEVEGHPDYSTALNGVQVDGPAEIARIACSVDVSEEVIAAAADFGADLLIVHHGLFWGGLQPLTGRLGRKVRALVENGIALWSCHLPLDGDAEFGNAALLARACGIEPATPFGSYQGIHIGWSGSAGIARADLVDRVAAATSGEIRMIAGGPERIDRVAFATGSGASFLQEAAGAGIDTLVTGEGSHHSYVDATELGVNLLYAGHYRTETFGVKALSAHLAERFELDWTFLDFPSGL